MKRKLYGSTALRGAPLCCRDRLAGSQRQSTNTSFRHTGLPDPYGNASVTLTKTVRVGWIVGLSKSTPKKLNSSSNKIRRSNRDEPKPLRQAVRERRIDGPEVIATGPNGNGGVKEGRERTLLIPVRGRERGTQPGRVEEPDPQGHTLGAPVPWVL
jgi:hypothetical protein